MDNFDPMGGENFEPNLKEQVRATALCEMQPGHRMIEKGEVMMVTEAQYVPGDYQLDDSDLQKEWDRRDAVRKDRLMRPQKEASSEKETLELRMEVIKLQQALRALEKLSGETESPE